MFKRILIANRGECAARLVRGCKELQIEPYLCVDALSPEVYPGVEAARVISTGRGRAAFEDGDNILQAALQYDCQGIFCGYGFLSEDPYFAQRCALYHRTFIGPQPRFLDIFGDKLKSKELFHARGIRTPRWFVAESFDEFCAQKDKFEFPFILKKRTGGGGKSVYCSLSAEEFELLCGQLAARGEKAASYLGEAYVANGRHVECQVLGDAYGTAVVAGWRDCSIQVRNQKWIEETVMGAGEEAYSWKDAVEKKLCEIFSSLNYRGLATVEFMVNDSGEYFFIEVNPRLQVEHGITEMVSGLDLVEILLRTSCGEPLSRCFIKQSQKLGNPDFSLNSFQSYGRAGHSLECRIYATSFCDEVIKWNIPLLWTLRGDCPVFLERASDSGEVMSPHFDGLLAKLLVWGKNRYESLNLMLDSLQKLDVEGVVTNKAWLVDKIQSLLD